MLSLQTINAKFEQECTRSLSLSILKFFRYSFANKHTHTRTRTHTQIYIQSKNKVMWFNICIGCHYNVYTLVF